MDIFPNTARIDFERQGDHVQAQLWEKGWIEGQWTDQCQYLVNTRIEAVLYQCDLLEQIVQAAVTEKRGSGYQVTFGLRTRRVATVCRKLCWVTSFAKWHTLDEDM